MNPFKGLRAFHEDDNSDFFGRDRLVADVVRRLDQGERLIGLVGPSGSGKSSVVRAGLIPALRKGAITGSDGWLIAQMVPGAHPFAELEVALLRSSLDAPDSLADQLADPETGILRAALRMIPSDESRLLLVINQLEELFTLVEDDDERGRFLAGLMAALEDPHGRVMVVLTLRADFYDRPLAYPEFGTRLGDGVVNVVSLTSDELEEAAQKPARRAGVTFEPALLAALLTDVVGRPGALPLFQYTMTELFDRRVGDTLTLDSYRAMDGVSGALTKRADDLYAELDRDQQAAAKQLFLRLVTIADGDEWGRRRVPASEIVSLDVDVVALQSVIELYTGHRLLTLDRDFVTGSPTVEVAHESLLTEWDRLRGWIEDGREDVHRHATLTTAMNEWIKADRDDDYLLGGTRLEGYEQWAASAVMQLTTDERAYLDAAVEVRVRTHRAEAERVALEAKTARSATRRLWGLAAAVAVLAAVGAWLLVAALAPEPPVIALLGVERDGVGGIRDQIADGFEQAQRDFGFQPDTVTPISDPRAEIEKFLDTGPGLVILENIFAVGRDSELAVEELAEKYPGVWFAVLEGAFSSEVDIPNVTFAAFRSEEGSFLAGAAAAITSQTRIIGFVGGPPIVIDAFRAGFEAGAKFVDPDVEILSRYLSGPGFEVFGDRALSEEAARDLFQRGADIIYHAAGEGGRGIFTAAAEGSNETTRLWGIGVDVNEYLVVDPELRDYVLTSVLKRHDSAVEVFIERYLDGTLESGPLELGLGNQGFDYARSGGFLDEATISELEDIRRAIIAGEITIPRLPDGPATSPPPADVEATLTFDGERCDLVGIGTPELGEFVRVSIENASPVEVVFGVFKFRDGTTINDLQESGPFAFSEFPGFFYTAARVNPGRTHALTVELAFLGVWGVTCFAENNEFHTPLFTVDDR